MSDQTSNPSLVSWLRAVGESTRLRLIVLCANRDVSVSDLAAAIGQSEPRVSRHLRILSEAGLIERLRQGQWVHYQVAREGPASAFVQGLLAQVERADPTYLRDRERLEQHDAAPLSVIKGGRLGRALGAFLTADVPQGSVLFAGVDHPEILVAAGDRGTAIAYSRRAAQSARAFVEREGRSCRVMTATSDTLTARDLERAGAPFDGIVLEAMRDARNLSAELAVARKALTPAGRLWLFANYESLESKRDKVVEHPIGRIRGLLSAAGFSCEKLSPIEADGEHVLAATAAATELNLRTA